MSKLTTDKQFDVLGVTFVQHFYCSWVPTGTPAATLNIALQQHQSNGRWRASCYTESSNWTVTREEALTSALDLFRRNFQRSVERAAQVEKLLSHIAPTQRKINEQDTRDLRHHLRGGAC